MVRPHGSEATDLDAANAKLYDETVSIMTEKLEIDWKVIEECLVAVVSDGAGSMGAYVDRLNVVREGARRELIAWVKDAAHCLIRAISTAKGSVGFWYNALDDVVALLACFYRTSFKRMRGLLRKGGKFCFSRCTRVFHELDIVLENLPDVLLHLPEYIEIEANSRRRDKAEGLLEALLHPLFKLTAAFFCDVFVVVCAMSKKIQATKGAQVDAVRGLMNVMCTQLMHTMRHVIPRGWEEGCRVGEQPHLG